MAERKRINISKSVLYESIRKRWHSENMICDVETAEISADKKKYYFANLKDNLIREMATKDMEAYGGASGQELRWKMRALYSSSAMTYNIFSVDDCSERKVDIRGIKDCKLPEGRYNLEFEKKLRALTNSACLDVYLESDKSDNSDSIILFEMKMTEWILDYPSLISDSYNPKLAKMPSEIAELLDEYIEKENGEYKKYYRKQKNGNYKVFYKAITTYFDVFQIIKHVLGIYNAIQNEKFPKVKKIRLVIGYWTIPDDLFDENDNKHIKQKQKYDGIKEIMENEIDDFIKNFNGIKKELFKEYDFKIERMTVEEIVKCLKKTAEENEYLKRYI